MNDCICSLKEGEEKLLNGDSWIDLNISLTFGKYEIYASSEDGMASKQINYCPICGAKIEV